MSEDHPNHSDLRLIQQQLDDVVHNKLDDIVRTLGEIRVQTTKTNGSVAELQHNVERNNEVLYGDRRRKTRGVVEQSKAAAEMKEEWDALKRVGIWIIIAVGSAAIALLFNLVEKGVISAAFTSMYRWVI